MTRGLASLTEVPSEPIPLSVLTGSPFDRTKLWPIRAVRRLRGLSGP